MDGVKENKARKVVVALLLALARALGWDEVEKLEAERDRLRAEVEVLRAALDEESDVDIKDILETVKEVMPDVRDIILKADEIVDEVEDEV